jgi:DNA helicase-2/ATP-dependent DNA helicase PcrA
MAKVQPAIDDTTTPRERATEASAAPVSLVAVQELLHGLNREQRRAVTHRDGAQLVVAGPGTGKTEVVTRRVAWLIATKRALPRQILALTFTEAAAQEMQARVDVLVPYGQADAAIHTFHALGDRLLREHAFELGLPGDVRLVSRAEAVLLLRENLFGLGLERFLPLGDPTRFLSALVDIFLRAKDEAVAPAAFIAHADELARAAAAADPVGGAVLADLAGARREVAAAYDAYQRLLARRGLIDHGDQIHLALRLLRERPAVRAAVAARYRYLLVDEFQDTNPCQLELVFELTRDQPNVTVVGDPDQAIYTFRGAATSNLRRFVAAHPDLRWVVLRRNYRSRAPILEASSRLIGHNRAETDLATTALGWPVANRRSRSPAPVQRLCFASVDAEADGVAEHISARITAGERPADFAVLVRTNGEVDSYARSLAVRGVPVRASVRSALVEQPVVRALLAYLRVVADPNASMELYLLAAAAPYSVSGADLAALLAAARRRHASLWAVLGDAGERDRPDGLSVASRDAIGRLVADVRAGVALAPLRTSGEVLYDYLRRSGLLNQLAAAEPAGDSVVLRSVVRFFDIIRGRAALLAEDRVGFLAPHLDQLRETGEEPDGPLDDASAKVLTVHRAKGLEFRYVYLCGLVDGRFPTRGRPPLLTLPDELLAHREGGANEDPLAEERRLAYVAMTRARDELWLCHHAAGRAGRGRRRPSPFLAEALDTPATALEQPAGLLARLAPPPPAVAGPPAKRRGGSGGSLALSYSQLDDYLSCPERYRLRHVVRVPTPAHHALAYGSAMHAAVAAFHLRRAAGQAMTEEQLLAAFAEAWSPEGYLSRQHEEARFAAGCDALRRFRADQLELPAETVAIEKPFAFNVGRDLVRGRMDRVDKSGDGAVIVDYKSSNVPEQAKADARARDSLQLKIYALAHQAETGRLPHEMQLHFLDSATIGRARPEPEGLEKAQLQIAAAADGIRSGQFSARPNPVTCGYCPYRDICAASAAKVA